MLLPSSVTRRQAGRKPKASIARLLRARWNFTTPRVSMGYKGLTQLQILHLGGTNVTDSGMEYLKGLTQLQNLTLVGTMVTDEGVRRLKQALPECEIER